MWFATICSAIRSVCRRPPTSGTILAPRTIATTIAAATASHYSIAVRRAGGMGWAFTSRGSWARILDFRLCGDRS